VPAPRVSAAQWSSKLERVLVHLRAALYLLRAVCRLAALVPAEPCLCQEAPL
jgi:hypothetical protein